MLYLLPSHSAPDMQWNILLKKDYQIIGSCGLIGISNDSAEVWYTIAHDWQGNGFACEALKAILAYSFETLMLTTIDAVMLESNQASHTVACKAGMHHFALLQNQWYENNALHNVLVYRLCASEYHNHPAIM